MNFLDCKIVNTWGIMYNCDIYNENEKFIDFNRYLGSINWNNIKTGSKLYIGLNYLNNFIENYLNKLKVPIFLITGHGDLEPIKSIIDNEKIIHWFSQNADFKHPKMTLIPIGMDYHTLATTGNTSWGINNTPINQENEIFNIRDAFKREKILKCYCNFKYTINDRKYGDDRINALNEIPSYLLFHEKQAELRIISWINQISYNFVISPAGNGLDCHRTYEALALGCIPIVKTGPLDELYIDLPVLIVKEWSDITLELLKTTLEEYKLKEFKMEKITLKYWNNIINEKVANYNDIKHKYLKYK